MFRMTKMEVFEKKIKFISRGPIKALFNIMTLWRRGVLGSYGTEEFKGDPQLGTMMSRGVVSQTAKVRFSGKKKICA